MGIRVVESAEPAEVKQTVDYVSDASAGGVVVIAFDPMGTAVLEALPEHVPGVAAAEPAAPDRGRVAIALDERRAAADATEHLLALGHRTVHHVAIPSEGRSSGRQAGWRDALARAGAEVPEVLGCGWDIALGLRGRAAAVRATRRSRPSCAATTTSPRACAARCTTRARMCPAM